MEHVTIIQIILTPLRKDDEKKNLFYFILVFLIFKFLIFILKIILKIFALYKVQIETELAFK